MVPKRSKSQRRADLLRRWLYKFGSCHTNPCRYRKGDPCTCGLQLLKKDTNADLAAPTDETPNKGEGKSDG